MLLQMTAFGASPSLLAAIVSLLAITTSASPLLEHKIEDLTYAAANRLKSRQDSGQYIAVTGVTGFGAPPRLEIRELQKNADQWNLYLLGLDRFMKVDQKDQLSYYSVCGEMNSIRQQQSWHC